LWAEYEVMGGGYVIVVGSGSECEERSRGSGAIDPRSSRRRKHLADEERDSEQKKRGRSVARPGAIICPKLHA
jgi:hypothetical protein